jgi:hypothetical protein
MPIPITNRAQLSVAQVAKLAAEVGGQATLHDILDWGFGHKPVRRVEEIVTQVLGYAACVFDRTEPDAKRTSGPQAGA